MNSNRMTVRWTAALLAGAIAVMSAAPAAEAHGRGHGGRNNDYRGGSGDRGAYYPRRGHEIRRSSSIGPAIIGLIGGIAIGATIAKASERDHYSRARSYPSDRDQCQSPRAGYDDSGDNCRTARSTYYYEDPYCHDRYASLGDCRSHMRDCGHPIVVRKICSETRQCVGTYGYEHGRWVSYGDDWNGARDDGNRDYQDDRYQDPEDNPDDWQN